MEKIDFTIVGDGSSDACLLPIVSWILRDEFSLKPINGEWADFKHLRHPPKTLPERIYRAIEFYEPNLLFVHRDAEKQDPQFRYNEISNALNDLKKKNEPIKIPHICIVPIRMTEAWLLFDEPAIRKAAGNPNGKIALNLPRLRNIETLPDPKQTLFDTLTIASELRGRQRQKFDPERHRHLVAEYIEDFSQLSSLTAFQRLQEDVRQLRKHH